MKLLKIIWDNLPFGMTDAVVEDQRAVNVVEPKLRGPKLEWPNTSPIDKTDPCWEFNNNTNINGTPYRKEEVSPGKWQWVVNQELLQYQRTRQSRKRKLAMDLQTRVLSEEEMQEVMRQGIYLFIENMVSYRKSDKQKEFNEAIFQQYRLRAIAKGNDHPLRARDTE